MIEKCPSYSLEPILERHTQNVCILGEHKSLVGVKTLSSNKGVI